MTREKLIRKILDAKSFDLGRWMKENYNFKGGFDQAIDLLMMKERYKNLINDAIFIEASKGNQKQI